MQSESSDMTGMPEERKAEATEAPSAFVDQNSDVRIGCTALSQAADFR